MRLIRTHYIFFPCCDAKSFLTADHLMGAVSGRAQVVFLSERLSEMCVYECILHTRGNQDTCWALWVCVIFTVGSPTLCRQIWGAQPLHVSTGECLMLRGDHSVAEKLLILILLIHKQQKIKRLFIAISGKLIFFFILQGVSYFHSLLFSSSLFLLVMITF